jgi:hypothetical protein
VIRLYLDLDGFAKKYTVSGGKARVSGIIINLYFVRRLFLNGLGATELCVVSE